MACAVVPRPMKPKAVVKSRNMPTAKTSSGVTSGSSRTMFAALEPGPTQRRMPGVARRPRTITTTNDSENVTCPMACAVVPRPMKPKAVVKSRNMPTAKTSSGRDQRQQHDDVRHARAGPGQRRMPAPARCPAAWR